MSNVITMTIDGNEIPLRATTSKSGNLFWAVLNRKNNGERYFSRYGVNIPAGMVQGISAKSTVALLGEKFSVSEDTNEKGHARFTAKGDVKVDGARKEFTFRVTALDDEAVNIAASVHGVSGSGGRHVLDEL